MSVNTSSARLHAYVAVASLAAAASLSVTFAFRPIRFDFTLAVLSGVTLLMAMLPVRLPGGGTIAISFPLLVAILILSGPSSAAFVALVASALSDVRAGKGPERIVFNAAQLWLSALLAGLVFETIMGAGLPAWGYGSLPLASYPLVVLATAGFAVAFLVINSMLVAGAISLSEDRGFLLVWRSNVSWHLSTQLALALLGLALVEAVEVHAVLGTLLFIAPLLLARAVFHSSARIRETYADTVRSLVAVIEAKDAYTRGHSERVASFAVDIAQGLGLPPDRVQRIELAALLHDLGKIAVDHAILQKSTSLTPAEMDEVRRHPETAAAIIASVPFLEDMTPAVLHHHERVDGRGYARGLAGSRIPLDARILSVADAYDAMTSERPYRSPLEREAAVAELRRQVGSQFDSSVVDVFITTCLGQQGLDTLGRVGVGDVHEA